MRKDLGEEVGACELAAEAALAQKVTPCRGARESAALPSPASAGIR